LCYVWRNNYFSELVLIDTNNLSIPTLLSLPLLKGLLF